MISDAHRPRKPNEKTFDFTLFVLKAGAIALLFCAHTERCGGSVSKRCKARRPQTQLKPFAGHRKVYLRETSSESSGSETRKRGSERVIKKRSTFSHPQKVRVQTVALLRRREAVNRKIRFAQQPRHRRAWSTRKLPPDTQADACRNRERVAKFGTSRRGRKPSRRRPSISAWSQARLHGV